MEQFRRRPGHGGVLAEPLDPNTRFTYLPTEQGDGWKCWRDEEGASTQEWTADYQEDRYVRAATEESLVLWDTVLHEHRACVAEEPNPYPAAYSTTEFKCPVAAAALSAFSSLGITATPLGDWPTGRKPARPADLKPLYRVPPAARAAYYRALTRSALDQALQVFGRVALVGRWRTRWDSPATMNVADVLPFQSQDAFGVLATAHLKRLATSVAFAAQSCIRLQRPSP